jgi:IS5 family transposase
LPKRTTVEQWDSRRPDYWAGQKGGRPIPKEAVYPKRGERLPKEIVDKCVKAFRTHSAAVAYAKLFRNHSQITTKVIYLDDEPIKLFIVRPYHGKLVIEKKVAYVPIT